MLTPRLLRAVNLSIAVLLIAVLAAVYWFSWRPLPQISGHILAPIAAKAAITRDARGVPHIRAGSWEDAIFLQGYAMAQDRMWQMDGMRRLAAGELAEVVGRRALASDEEARRMRLGRIADAQERALSPEDRALFAAFARGVNFYLKSNRGRLPVEFTLLGYDPRPWTVHDSILCGLEMYRRLTTGWRAEIAKQQMLERGDRTKVEALFPVRSGNQPQPGSNAWVISGARSTTGKPILANDPHLELSIPSPWYLVQLEAPGLDVTGASIVGLPAVIVGHNARIAWGVTNLEFDVQDLYREQIDPQTGRDVYQGKVEQAQAEREVIAVKGAQPADLIVWTTRHGPVILAEDGQYYALRWSAAEPGAFTFPFLDIDRAQNWSEFSAAIMRYGGPAQNFLYADSAGNIGYHAAGLLPLRKDCKGDVPADGSTGECEWNGFIPFDQLPQSFNPVSGIIASANQNPFPEETAFLVNGNFAPRYRAEQIRALLASRAKWKPEEMLGVQTDVYSAFMSFLAQQTVAAWDRSKPPALKDAAEVLRHWNGQMQKGEAAPLLATLGYEQLRRVVAERAAPGLGDSYRGLMAPQALETLLRERSADWFPDWDAVLLRSLTGAVAAGTKVQGSRISRWDLGQYQGLRIVNPVIGQLPLVGRYFNLGPVPMSGSPNSVLQYTGQLAPSMRMVVDLGDLEHSMINLAVGESGQPLSTHYKDQFDAYSRGRSFPMAFGKVDGNVLEVAPQ